jgi:hypothetical protein
MRPAASAAARAILSLTKCIYSKSGTYFLSFTSVQYFDDSDLYAYAWARPSQTQDLKLSFHNFC